MIMRLRSFFMRRALIGFMVFFLALPVGLTPTPARAEFDIPNWIVTIIAGIVEYINIGYEIVVKNEITAVLMELYDNFVEYFQDWRELLGTNAAIEYGGYRAGAKQYDKMAQARVDAHRRKTIAELSARAAGEHMQPVNQGVCKKVVMGKGVADLAPGQAGRARTVTKNMNDRNRAVLKTAGGGEAPPDGNGPAYAAKTIKDMQDQKIMHPIDGVETKYVRSGEVWPGGQMWSDLSMTMPQLEQTFALAMPKTMPTKDGDRTVNYAKPNGPREEAFVAKMATLDNLVGPTPTPLRGEALKTPVGRIQRAAYNHALTMTNVLRQACESDTLFYVRPNCEMEGDQCEKQKQVCLAGTGGLVASASYSDCMEGMSPYETLRLEQQSCLSEGQILDQLGGGASFAEASETLLYCGMVDTNFKTLAQIKRDNCRKATIALARMEMKWQGVENLGRGGRTVAQSTSPEADMIAPTTAPVDVFRASMGYKGEGLR